MPSTIRARILAGHRPTTSASQSAIVDRLTATLSDLRTRRLGPAKQDLPSSAIRFDDMGFELDDPPNLPPHVTRIDAARIEWRARRFVQRRDAIAPKVSGKVDRALDAQLAALADGGRAVTVTRAEADEIAAALHAEAPWMEAASRVFMAELRRRTVHGPGLAGVPPVRLTGPPGIGKSAWAQHLGRCWGCR